MNDWLKREFAGLPVWVWLLLSLAGAGAAWFLRARVVGDELSDEEIAEDELGYTYPESELTGLDDPLYGDYYGDEFYGAEFPTGWSPSSTALYGQIATISDQLGIISENLDNYASGQGQQPTHDDQLPDPDDADDAAGNPLLRARLRRLLLRHTLAPLAPHTPDRFHPIATGTMPAPPAAGSPPPFNFATAGAPDVTVAGPPISTSVGPAGESRGVVPISTGGVYIGPVDDRGNPDLSIHDKGKKKKKKKKGGR